MWADRRFSFKHRHVSFKHEDVHMMFPSMKQRHDPDLASVFAVMSGQPNGLITRLLSGEEDDQHCQSLGLLGLLGTSNPNRLIDSLTRQSLLLCHALATCHRRVKGSQPPSVVVVNAWHSPGPFVDDYSSACVIHETIHTMRFFLK